MAARLEQESQAIQAGLAGCSALLGELADNLAPWSVKDNASKVHETKAQLDKTCACVASLLNKAVRDAQVTRDCKEKLEEREVLLVKSAEQEQALLRSFQQYTAQQAMVRSLLQLVDEDKLASKESRLAAGGRLTSATTTDNMLEMLSLSVRKEGCLHGGRRKVGGDSLWTTYQTSALSFLFLSHSPHLSPCATHTHTPRRLP